MQSTDPSGGIMSENAVEQSEEKYLLKLVEEAFRSLGNKRVNTVRLPNQEVFRFRRQRIEPGAKITFHAHNKDDANIDIGEVGGQKLSIRIEKGVANIVRRNVNSNRFI